jgi:hypothetical protein
MRLICFLHTILGVLLGIVASSTTGYAEAGFGVAGNQFYRFSESASKASSVHGVIVKASEQSFGDTAPLEGLFIARLKKPIPPQRFDPQSLVMQDGLALFIEFKKGNPRFIRVGAKSYRVRGSFSITSARKKDKSLLRIIYDNATGYISIFHHTEDADGESNAVLGLSDLEVVANTVSNSANDLVNLRELEAESYPNELTGYDVSENGIMLLGNLLQPGTLIGLELAPQSSPCLNPETRFIASRAYKKLIRPGVQRDERKRMLREALLRAERVTPGVHAVRYFNRPEGLEVLAAGFVGNASERSLFRASLISSAKDGSGDILCVIEDL